MDDLEKTAAGAVDRAIAELHDFHLLISDSVDPGSHRDYVQRHRHEYVRTVRDVLKHRPVGDGQVKVLEIGAFFGVVCMALASLGYSVTAADIPEYIELPEQIERYRKFGIQTKGVRLEEFVLPFADEQFDIVIMCEVLEHLNFNPLPLLKEINRIGRPASIFYVSMPNAGSVYNRLAVLRGNASGVQISEFFEQLDPSNSLVANGHWREYTMAETRRLLEPLGYRIVEQYGFSLGETQAPSGFKSRIARRFFRAFPFLKENQTTVALREKRTDLRLHLPTTVHREIRQL